MNHPSVLLADDNRLLVKQVAEHLASSFDVVGTAHDGQDLVVKAMRLTPDVVVVDITMPILTGIEAVHQLRNAGLRNQVRVSDDTQRKRIPGSVSRRGGGWLRS